MILSAAGRSQSERVVPRVRASIRGRRSAYERAAHVWGVKFKTSRQAPSRLRRAPHWRQTRAPTCGKPLPARLLGLRPPCLGRPRRAVRSVQAFFCNLNECVYTVYTRPRSNFQIFRFNIIKLQTGFKQESCMHRCRAGCNHRWRVEVNVVCGGESALPDEQSAV